MKSVFIFQINILIKSVEKFGKEFQIIIFNKEEIDIDFYQKNKYILESKRGGGYWLWKPYIINKILNKINENDVLLYLDSTYYFTEKFTDLYQKHLEKNDLLVFKNKPNESTNCMKHLCKMDVVIKYNMYNKLFIENVEEYWAGCIFIKKTENTMEIMKEWLQMCCNHDDITDSPSQNQNYRYFWDHRHDQALLSIILHKKNITPCHFEKNYLQNMRYPY